MKKKNIKYFKVSLIISFFLSMIIPSTPVDNGILKYNYGFPFTYITIYQNDETSAWFFDNFFNGNVGILLNPLVIIVNAIPLYYIIVYLIILYDKIQKKK